jgi:hypothetical protein
MQRPEKNEWLDEESNTALMARNQAYQTWLSRPTRAKRKEDNRINYVERKRGLLQTNSYAR